MKDRFGRINNRYQAIGEFSLIELACLLSMISNYPNEYPNSITDWKEWLEQESGKDVESL